MRFRRGVWWLAAFAMAGSAQAFDAARTLGGTVFEDRNGDGRQSRYEPGVAGVAMSNGRALAITDDRGRYRLPVSPGQTVFAIKPAGWRLPGSDFARPGAWRQLPDASSTAAWPKRFDVALQRAPAGDGWLEVRVFADPQVKSSADVDYYARDIVDSVLNESMSATGGAVARHRPALGLSLGDIVDDRPALYPALNAQTRRIGVPWLHVAGNHDVDPGASNDEDSLRAFRGMYGPDTFAWEEDAATFVGFDDIIAQPGRSPGYIGGLREDQFAFLEAYLPRVAKDRLLVLAMHIPLFEPEGRDTFRDADRARLFALLRDFPKVLVLSGHSHSQQHWLHDARTGWQGTTPLHEYNVGAACGAYWSGAKDAAGIPDTTMPDGTPNGYASLGIDRDGRYVLGWHPARDPQDSQIGLYAPKVLRQGAYPAYGVYANVYMGRDDTRVEFRIDGGEWKPMRRTVAPDPRVLRENVLDADAETLRGYDRSAEATFSPHLWRGTLPTDLAAGAHRIEVRAFDAWRGEVRAQGDYRLQTAE